MVARTYLVPERQQTEERIPPEHFLIFLWVVCTLTAASIVCVAMCGLQHSENTEHHAHSRGFYK